MQAWTSVLVSNKDHPRANSAGVCQGQPFTPEAASNTTAAQLDQAAKLLEARVSDGHAALDELNSSVAALEIQAKDARHAADDAAREAAGEHTDTAPRVLVKFDSDGETLACRVEDLQTLG